MNPQDIQCFLLWSLAINYGILLAWFGIFVFAHDWYYRLQVRWFRLPVETFDAINYGAMAFYDICIALFNLVPFIALTAIL